MGISATTLTYLSIAGTVASTAVGMMGAQQQAAAQKQQANYQAAIARNNQTVAQWKADDAIKRGKAAQDEHRQNVVAFKGKQRAAMAASGFDINEDDALDILADTAEIGELDALTIKSNAAREAWGHQVEGSNAGAQAGLYDSKANNINSAFAMGTELFSGIGSVADKWAKVA